MKQKNKRLQRAWQIATGIFSALFIMILSLLGYTAISRASGNPLPTVFGWSSAVVLSGSMEPQLPIGALLLIHREDNYEVGDIVTFEDEYVNIVTYRLVSLENGEAVTKGDANNVNDAPFPASRIYGKVRAVLPGIGNAILWLKTPIGLCTIFLVGGILIILPNFLLRKEDKTHDRK